MRTFVPLFRSFAIPLRRFFVVLQKPLLLSYIYPRLYCAFACPCSAALRCHFTRFLIVLLHTYTLCIKPAKQFLRTFVPLFRSFAIPPCCFLIVFLALRVLHIGNQAKIGPSACPCSVAFAKPFSSLPCDLVASFAFRVHCPKSHLRNCVPRFCPSLANSNSLLFSASSPHQR